MDTTRVGEVEAFKIDGVTNHVLLKRGTFDSRNLLVTWVTIAPGGQQPAHTHPGSEQVCVIIAGSGRFSLGSEKQIVAPGTAIYIPPSISHSMANAGAEELVYITVASPPFPVERYYA